MNKTKVDYLSNEYIKLHKIVEFLGINMFEYRNVVLDYNQDRKEAIKKHLFFEDENNEINDFQTFVYLYIAENTVSYFHNMRTKNYTKGFLNLCKEYLSILNKKIDFDDFLIKEVEYGDILVDILASNLEYELKKIGKTFFAISLNTGTCIYMLTDYEVLKNIKKIKSELFTVYDTLALEKIYGLIYKLKEKDENLDSYIKKGDYIMELKDQKGIYTTLFSEEFKENILISNLTNKQKENLRIVL